MRHARMGGAGRHHHHSGEFPNHGRGGHGRHGGRPGRLFDYGELRLLLLAMLSERPSHGYELIKAVEERSAGGYAPSPGVIYPTLAWLEDMGYAMAEADAAGRRQYRLTAEGEAFLAASRAGADELLSRLGPDAGGRRTIPAPVVRAMANLRTAMRLRLRRGPLDEASADSIAATLDAAAQAIERS